MWDMQVKLLVWQFFNYSKNDFEVTIKEALHIKFKKPTINRQLYSQGSSFVLNVF